MYRLFEDLNDLRAKLVEAEAVYRPMVSDSTISETDPRYIAARDERARIVDAIGDTREMIRLRDSIATAALRDILVSDVATGSMQRAATLAYQQADAMLIERLK